MKDTIVCQLKEAMYAESDAMTRTARKFGRVSTWGDALSQRLLGILNAAIYLGLSKEGRDELVELMNRLNKRFDEDAEY